MAHEDLKRLHIIVRGHFYRRDARGAGQKAGPVPTAEGQAGPPGRGVRSGAPVAVALAVPLSVEDARACGDGLHRIELPTL